MCVVVVVAVVIERQNAADVLTMGDPPLGGSLRGGL